MNLSVFRNGFELHHISFYARWIFFTVRKFWLETSNIECTLKVRHIKYTYTYLYNKRA